MGFEGIGDGIKFLYNGFLVLLLVVILFVIYTIYSFFKETIIESEVRLEPTIKLTTNGSTVDTIYVYKLKK